MVKIAWIGAGSHVFGGRLILDLLSYPELRDSTVSMMAQNPSRLGLSASFAKRVASQHDFPTKIEATTNRRAALNDADYVIMTIRVGGIDAYRDDLGIPAKYGIKQAFGDTLGPGGIFAALRHIPALLDLCEDIHDLCPNALLLNYSNPMAMLCWAASSYANVKSVGICDSVQNTASELARYIGAPIEQITYWAAGINHMAWFLEFKWRGDDAYPLLREVFKDPNVYSGSEQPDIVRAEIFKATGYYSSESSQHLSEYLPYFRKRPELFDVFRLGYALDLSEEALDGWRREAREFELQSSRAEAVALPQAGTEDSFRIIHSIETNTIRRVNGNVRNDGFIANLPTGCCVEVPLMVDGTGVRPCYVGDIPPQCAGLNRTNISVQELAVKAAVEKSRTLAFEALVLDPLTSAMLTIEEIRRMADEMFEAERKYLPNFR